MFIDLESLEDGTTIESDVCIIGAGPAGITTGLELARRGVNVALFESGDFDFRNDIQSLYEGDPNLGHPYSIAGTRLRMFGGTSNHWGGRCRPFDPSDFEKRSWIPNTGWPISYNDLEDYYKKAQSILELGPYRYDWNYWRSYFGASDENAIFNDQGAVVSKPFQMSPPTNFGKLYRDIIRSHDSVRCFLKLNATKIIAGGSQGETITGVNFISMQGKRAYAKAKVYIIAVGGLETPRLLLSSNDMHANGIGNHSDMVGRYFQEHIYMINAATIYLFPDLLNKRYFEKSFLREAEGIRDSGWISEFKDVPSGLPVSLSTTGFGLSAAAQREHKLLNVGGWIQSMALSEDISENDFSPENISEYMEAPVSAMAAGKTMPVRRYAVSTLSEQIPDPDSRVELIGSKDALGMQQIGLNWKVNEYDQMSIYEALKLMGNQIAQRGLGRVKINLSQPREKWRVGGGAHHMGTTRMHNDPKQGVTDSDTKVHGINNLYIGGSATFTNGGFANPTLTIIAMSLRLAEHISSIMME